jgi:endo-1,3(4)-beta-glucanase
MIPIAPPSALIRLPNFVAEEWTVYFDHGRAEQVEGGWRGILFANLCLISPQVAYDFFSKDNFDYGLLDGGASRTWYLAYTAAMGGA